MINNFGFATILPTYAASHANAIAMDPIHEDSEKGWSCSGLRNWSSVSPCCNPATQRLYTDIWRYVGNCDSTSIHVDRLHGWLR